MKINLKKIFVSLLMVIGFVSYAAYQRYFIGQQTPVNNPPLDTAATDTTSGMVSSTTVSQAETTLPPTDTTGALNNSGFNVNRVGDNEDGFGDDDEDGFGDEDEDDDVGFVPPQTLSSGQTGTSSSSTTGTITGNTTTTATTSGSPSTTATTTSAAAGNTATVANALYKDGQYDGNSADAYYGLVQVRAIIQGGQLTDVQFLRYPSDRSYSVELNTYAMPILKSEAIQGQNANVNIVTGATNTSRAFVNSLSSALGQALV